MLTNKNFFKFAILLLVVYCAPGFSATDFYHQMYQTYKFEDTTQIPGGNEIAVNGTCASKTIAKFAVSTSINADQLYNLCLPNTTTCVVTFHVGTDAQNCAGAQIGSVTFDVYNGIKSIQNDPSSMYQLFFKTINIRTQQVSISGK